MIAFICATPLQVFNAINIMHHHFESDQADIIALNYRVDLRPLLCNANNCKYIHDVIYIDYKLHNDFLGILKDYLMLNKDFDKLDNHSDYSDLFTTWVGGYGTIIFTKLFKYNKDIKLHFYEEGIGVYTHNILQYYGRIQYFYKLLNYRCESNYLNDIYVYNSKIMFKDIAYPAIGIGCIDKNDIELVNQLSSIYNKTNSISHSTEKIFYLDNYLEPSIFGEFDQVNMLNLLDKKIRTTLLVRKHPITNHNNYEKNGYKIDDNNLPWETCIMQNENLKEKILITLLSTAAFSPKLIFNEEPYIVILGKAVKNYLSGDNAYAENYYSDEFSLLVNHIKEIYVDKSKVIVPESISEFYTIMEELVI